MKALGIILLTFFIVFFSSLIIVPIVERSKIKKNK